MEFLKNFWENHKFAAILSIVWVFVGFGAYLQPLEETGELPSTAQYIAMNIANIALVAFIDFFVIKKSEKKQRMAQEEEKKKQEQKELAEKEMSITINIKSGGLGRTGICIMHQLFENNLFYFDNDSETLYEMIAYEWDGAKYKRETTSQTKINTTGKNKADGLIIGGGLAVASGKTRANSNTISDGNVTEREVEQMGTAIIRIKRKVDDRSVSFIIDCNSDIDKQIRCFNNVPT